jgi:hypothetical protein
MPSEQGITSIGAQGGSVIQAPDRYSGTGSSTANTAMQQPRGSDFFKQLMGHSNYLQTSPQQRSHARPALGVNRLLTYQAMTATLSNARVAVSSGESVTNPSDIFERALETLNELPLWMPPLLCTPRSECRGLFETDGAPKHSSDSSERQCKSDASNRIEGGEGV